MAKLCLILGDQLSLKISSLKEINKNEDTIMLCEVSEETNYVKHHPKKIALIFSAMRHFAKLLQSKGYQVRYVKLDDTMNTGSFTHELKRALREKKYTQIIVTEPGEWRVSQMFVAWQEHNPVPIKITIDDRFLCSASQFEHWTKDKKQLRMEFFYREMRKKYRILVNEDDTPIGGKWNFDAENRKIPTNNNSFPGRLSHKPNNITTEVLSLVQEQFSNHFGDLYPFDLAVDRASALKEAKHFIENYLPLFGDYQDAMIAGEPYLYHSRLSAYLNLGLLLPLELCHMAESAYYAHQANINSVEGFIRQILGWREYVRGIYWKFMPAYQQQNALAAKLPLPDFYWGKSTHMFCMQEVVNQTKQYAYSHHIQRLMITGNFALLAGLNPDEVCEWYLAVYCDAYEWVELPNTLGMALFADGGIMASKPYAASGKYIHRMSNFCQSCTYNPKITMGDKACPFNALYWGFIDKNSQALHKNPRMHYAYRYWDNLSVEQKNEIKQQVLSIFKKLSSDEL